MLKKTAILILACVPCFAALSSTVQFEVRTTGSGNNGGGFDPGVSVPGTDFSQQDAAQIAYTDLVIGGTTTQYTSAAHPVGATISGNLIQIISGSGCTAGVYEVVSTSGTTATVDRSMGTGASTCTANLGGGFQTLGQANAQLTLYSTVWVKAGTYTLTSTLSVGQPSYWNGYNSTHGDRTTRPLITTATDSTNLITLTTSNHGFYLINLSLSNTASTRAVGLALTGSFPTVYLQDCLLDGFTTGLALWSGGQASVIGIMGTEIKNCSVAAVNGSYAMSIYGSYIHDNTEDGVVFPSTNNSTLAVSNTVFSKNGRYAIYNPTNTGENHISNCVFYTNGTTFTGHPFNAIFGVAPFVIVNNVFYGGALLYVQLGSDANLGRNNAVDSVGLGIPSNPTQYSSTGDVTLTADPFVAASSGNFALNSTAGGGALLLKAGFPGVGPAGTGYLDIGAVQTSGGTGGGMVVSAYTQ